MRTGMMAFAFGLGILRFLAQLPPLWLIVTMLVVGLALLAQRFVPAGALLLGLGWACLQAQWVLDDRLSQALDGQTVWLEGRVSSLPTLGASGVRFELRDVQSRRGELPARVRVSWHAGPQVQVGERWRLAVTLRRPRSLVNPGGDDQEARLLSQRIGATGSVKHGGRLEAAPVDWREGLRQRLRQIDAQGRNGALAALVIGDSSGVSREDWDILQATGTIHLLVISGQHVGLLASLIYGLVAGLARYGLWPRRLPWLPWACSLAFAAALAYGAMAGFQVPVRRALFMLGMVLLWRLRFRRLSIGWPLLCAWVTVLFIDPLASLQAGFWLSFLAVAVLLLVFAGRLGPWPWWLAWTRAQCLIAVGLLPALLALVLPISLSAPVANLFAVPWISLVVLPTALLGTLLLAIPWVGELLLLFAGGMLDVAFMWLAWLAGRWPAWQPGTLSWWLLALISLGAFLLLLPAGLPMRLLGWPLLLLALFPLRPTVDEGEVEVWHLDVGQGLAVILRTREHTMLYDAGPRSGEFDAGARVVLPALRSLGVRELDLLLVSHGHADHAGGARAVQQAMPVRRVVAGEPDALDPLLAADSCEPGTRWEWNGVRFTLWRWLQASDSNSASCVLLVEAKGERLLLSGDIEAAAERALVEDGLDIRADWLQAPHHGSRTSSTPLLLKAVRPNAVVISRGYGHAFRHPHPSVSARFSALGIAQYDTALHGALRVRLGRFETAQVSRAHRRFWRTDAVPQP